MPSKCCHFHARRNLRSAGNAMGVWVPGLLHYLRRPQLEGRWRPVHEPVSTVSNAMRTFASTNLSTGAEMRAPNLGAQRDAGRGRRHGAFRLTSGGQSISFAATGRDPHPDESPEPTEPVTTRFRAYFDVCTAHVCCLFQRESDWNRRFS